MHFPDHKPSAHRILDHIMIGTHNPLNHIRPRAIVRNAGTGSEDYDSAL